MTAEPFLLTERLELWLPRASDLPGLHAMMQSDFTRRYLGAWEPTVADLYARMLRNVGSWRLYGYGTLIVRQRGQAANRCGCSSGAEAAGQLRVSQALTVPSRSRSARAAALSKRALLRRTISRQRCT